MGAEEGRGEEGEVIAMDEVEAHLKCRSIQYVCIESRHAMRRLLLHRIELGRI